MENEKFFKTKTGFCHILPDKIILTRDGIIGNIAKATVGKNSSGNLVLYSILSAGFFYFAIEYYKTKELLQSIFFMLLGSYLTYGVINSINNSTTPIIDRNKIREVKFKKSILGLTRSRFEVFFDNGYGKIKKRIIMLPGSLSDGKNETEKAIKIMTEEKIIPSI